MGSTASGAYQFTDPTWHDAYRKTYNRSPEKKHAKEYSSDVQDTVANKWFNHLTEKTGSHHDAIRAWNVGLTGSKDKSKGENYAKDVEKRAQGQ